ncbi:hypothetical protein [Microbulbifer hydrolyticus]|uniref:Uncharacterized protein n=1 Tax=Microbulbifer hydrolyticus TaxID=48074 RepID=A0A6P1T9E6_9GAMM|nr:hypothetical protein [Microbulbifer hydrolyticus]MBB5210060.1 hypothetical protein [Microbulbifer hydrolyticus]QHQ39418.1 hypothetical protein GTQ55_10805 [Microbulbifer hydrolyticus]
MRKSATHRFSATLPIPVILFAILALPATAETLQKRLQQCSQFSDDEKRLACYDKLSGGLQQHAEQQFGQEQKQVIEEAPDSITATIIDAKEGAYGKFTFTLDNGQIWRQVDSSSRAIWRGGEQVTVERGALGSFLMRKTTGGRTLRVKRVK